MIEKNFGEKIRWKIYSIEKKNKRAFPIIIINNEIIIFDDSSKCVTNYVFIVNGDFPTRKD